jgi:hypothetical protein
MKQPKIRYYWGNDHLLVDLGNRIEPRIRIIYWIEFLITTGIATIFLLQSFSLSENRMHVLASLAVGFIYLLAAYRFFSRMFYREQISVSDNHFTIIRKTLFRHSMISYDWERMGPLHYKGKEAKTDHPLKGKCFDYFGFDTQERLVQDLHHDGNLYFDYGNTAVRFARGIYSWHAEEIVRMIRLYSGTSLQLGEEWKNLMQEMDWTNEH